MRVSEFSFDLPPELIAQHPPTERGSSRMLRLDRHTGGVADDHFHSLPQRLAPGDLLILNNSRVLPARLFATRAGLQTQGNSPAPTGTIEVLLTENLSQPGDPHPTWRALVRPARKVLPGETLLFAHPDAPTQTLLTAQVLTAGERGERTLRLTLPPSNPRTLFETVEHIGHMPLPPYIDRDQAHAPDTPEDRERYQTVYAAPPGSSQGRSAAAPTAGLHFTPEILAELQTRGVEIQYLTLHVGLGTFQPVRVDQLADIRLHAEPYTLPPSTAEALNRAYRDRRRIIAVGTTTTRTLEHLALQAHVHPEAESADPGHPLPDLQPHSGTTSLFIAPGHHFRLVSGLLTNFHLPESTLLMLVSAFAGVEATRTAYAHAVRERYRFFSYGDCMLIL